MVHILPRWIPYQSNMQYHSLSCSTTDCLLLLVAVKCSTDNNNVNNYGLYVDVYAWWCTATPYSNVELILALHENVQSHTTQTRQFGVKGTKVDPNHQKARTAPITTI